MMIVPLYINQALYVAVVLTLLFRNCFQQGQHPCGDSRAQFENITTYGNGQFNEILTCRSESEIQLSTLKWIDLTDMEIDISDSEKFTTTTNELTVKNVEPADEGVYKCMFNGNQIGNDEYCLTVQGIPTLISSDCINNICSVNVSYNSSYTIFASFVNKYVGFDQSVADVERVQLVMGVSQLSVCLQTICQDGSADITGHNDNYPNVTFNVSSITEDVTYSLEATVTSIQPETLTYVFSVINTSSLSGTMESISSTSMFSMNSPSNTVTITTSTTTDSTTIPPSNMSSTPTAGSQGTSLNTTGIAVGAVLAVVVPSLVIILVIVIMINIFYRRSKSITKYNVNNNMCATFSINQTEPSTLGGEDHFELDHKKNSEPRSV